MTVEIDSSGLFHRWKYFNRVVQCRDSSSGVSRIFDLTNSVLMVRNSCVLNGLNGSSKMVEKRALSMKSQSGYKC